MENFEFILTSYDDSENFVVEIWHENNLIAIINDNDELQVFGEYESNEAMTNSIFFSVVEEAKKKLNS